MENLPFKYQKREYWEFYCPICKAQRRSFYWPSPRKKHYISLAMLGVTLAVFTFPFVGIKGAFLIFPIWGIFEFVYRARARQSLICSNCGFDPYLYKFDVTLARSKVEQFWQAKKKNSSDPSLKGLDKSPIDKEVPNKGQSGIQDSNKD